MFYYKNVSSSEKTFHGVTFQPGEIKQVNKYINHKWMVLMEKETFENQHKPQKPSDKPKNPVLEKTEQKPVGKEEKKEEVKEVPHVEGNVQKSEPKKDDVKEEKKELTKVDQPKPEDKKPQQLEQKS